MAAVTLRDGTLSVTFTHGEKVWGLVRDLDVPVFAITDETVEADGLRVARGRGGKSLVSVRRNQAALAVRLQWQRYDGLLIGLDDPQEYVDRVLGAR